MEHLKKLKKDYLEKDKAQSARVDDPHKLTQPIDQELINYENEGGIVPKDDFSTNNAAGDPIKTEAERLISTYKTAI